MFKVGDIVKYDLNGILTFYKKDEMPRWYDSKKRFTVFEDMCDNFSNVFVKTNSGTKTIIWCDFLMLDICAMRRNKLKRLSNV